MAIAGKVAITSRGEWTDAAAYTKLDFVKHGNASYVARKASTGIEPPNEEYWMLSLDNSEIAADVEALGDSVDELSASTVSWQDATGSVKKNLLVYPYDSSFTQTGGMTITENDNGTITFNGTSTGYVTYRFHNGRTNNCPPFLLKKGTYILTIENSELLNNKGYCWLETDESTPVSIFSHIVFGSKISDEFTLSEDTYLKIGISATAGFSGNNVSIKPMIRKATISDSTYVPYIPDNAELDEAKVSWTDAGRSVKKNYLHILESVVSQTIDGITYTVNRNENGEVTSLVANGTATSESWLTFAIRNQKVTQGKFVLTGCPNGGEFGKYELRLSLSSVENGDETKRISDFGNGNEYTIDGDYFYRSYCGIVIWSGVTVDNLIFRPMIRPASIKDPTFVPYIPDNVELEADKVGWAEQGMLGAKNLYKVTAVSRERRGIYYTINEDGSIHAQGTAAGGGSYLNFSPVEGSEFQTGAGDISTFYLKKGTYIATSENSINSRIVMNNINGVAAWRYVNPSYTFTVTDETHPITIGCYIPEGTTVDETYRIMVRLASDPDDAYQPYSKTNQQLTTEVDKLRPFSIVDGMLCMTFEE